MAIFKHPLKSKSRQVPCKCALGNASKEITWNFGNKFSNDSIDYNSTLPKKNPISMNSM
jgi:hypothetical protein